MACFSLLWIEQLLIWVIVIAAVIGIIKLLLPALASIAGSWGGLISGVVNILCWAIVAIAVIRVIFSLLSCAMGGTGLHL